MADEDEAGEEAYQVGYGRPPKQHQFQKGRSGNPSGRPKGARNLKTIVDDVFSEPVRLRRDGAFIEVSTAEAMLRSMTHKAMKGDVAAFRAVQTFLSGRLEAGSAEDSEAVPLTAEEQEILVEHLRFLQTRGG